MTNTVTLLPCPFCGGDAEQDYQRSFRWLSDGRIDHGAAMYCTFCNADMIVCRGDHPELSDEERMERMVENWNRRATPPQPNFTMLLQSKAESIRTEYQLAYGRPCDCSTADGALHYGRAQGFELAADIIGADPARQTKMTSEAWTAKAAVLRARGKNNTIHDINQVADYLEAAAAMVGASPERKP